MVTLTQLSALLLCLKAIVKATLYIKFSLNYFKLKIIEQLSLCIVIIDTIYIKFYFENFQISIRFRGTGTTINNNRVKVYGFCFFFW